MYNQTRRLVLAGADGIVFVADSQWDCMENNADSFQNLQENLKTHSRTLDTIPYLLQFNKRDLASVAPVEYMDFLLNRLKTRVQFFETMATHGIGVAETLNTICKMVMAQFIDEHKMTVDELVRKGGETKGG